MIDASADYHQIESRTLGANGYERRKSRGLGSRVLQDGDFNKNGTLKLPQYSGKVMQNVF